MKKITRVISTAFLAFLIVLTTACSEKSSLLTSDDLKAFSENLDNNQYNTAIKIYDDLSPEDMTNANKLISYKVESIVEGYFNGIIDYSSASKALQAYTVFSNSSVNEALIQIEQDNIYTIRLKEAESFIEDEQYLAAIKKLDEIDASYRNFSEASDLMNQCIPLYRESIQKECEVYESVQNYSAIFSVLQSAEGELPNDITWSELNLLYKKSYTEYISSQIEELNREEKYFKAMETIRDSYSTLENFFADALPKELTELYDEEKNLYCDFIVESLNVLIAEEKYTEVIDSVYEYKDIFLTYFGSELPEPFAAIVADCQRKHCEQCIETAKGYAEKKDYQSAVNILDACEADKQYLSGSLMLYQSLCDLRDQYKDKLPIYLNDCPEIERGYFYNSRELSNVTNQFGYTYAKALLFENHEESYILYNPNERYSLFNFTIWSSYGDAVYEDSSVSLYIYCDGVLVQSIENIKNETDPADYSIDITGCRKLKLVFSFSNYIELYLGNAILSN